MRILRRRTSRSCALLLILSTAMMWISSTGQRLNRYMMTTFNQSAAQPNRLGTSVAGFSFSGQTSPVVGRETKARVRAAYGKLPLSFELNEGQADSRVTFVSRGAGHALSLTPDEVSLKLDVPSRAAPIQPTPLSINPQGLAAANIESKSAVLRMRLIGDVYL